MRQAFKDWAVVVDALGRGEQIIILRKGGLREGRGGFKMESDRFFLLPTLYHQQRDAVIPSAQARFDALPENWPPEGRIHLDYFAEVVTWRRLESLSVARQLQDQHIWRDEVIAQRFEWGRHKQIFALAVRVWQLPQALELPMRPQYGGCKSWIELEQDLATEGAVPVLSEAELAQKRTAFENALTMPLTSQTSQ